MKKNKSQKKGKFGSGKRLLIWGGIILAALLILGVLFYLDNIQKQKIMQGRSPVLMSEISLVNDFVLSRGIIGAVQAANQKHEGITLEEILPLDQAWVNAVKTGVKTQTMEDCMSGVVATELMNFQKAHPEFVEIFITDKYGLNVGQTDITSDYYQADEEWWQRAYNKGQGEVVLGAKEFDESSRTEVFDIFFPVVYSSPHNAIGVIKALISAKYFKE